MPSCRWQICLNLHFFAVGCSLSRPTEVGVHYSASRCLQIQMSVMQVFLTISHQLLALSIGIAQIIIKSIGSNICGIIVILWCIFLLVKKTYFNAVVDDLMSGTYLNQPRPVD